MRAEPHGPGLSLDHRIENEIARGGRIESRTAKSAVIIHGRRVNHVLHFLIGLLTLGLWWGVWILLAIFGGERRVVLTDLVARVDRDPRSHPRDSRSAPALPARAPAFCPHCNEVLTIRTRICPGCDARVSEAGEVPP